MKDALGHEVEQLGRELHPHAPWQWTPEERITEYGYDPYNTPMMECGHAANAVWNSKDGPRPSCVICFDGPDSKGAKIAAVQVDLSQRRARCAHYGQTPSGRSHSSNYGCKRGERCLCEEPSSPQLPFFEHKPGKDFDVFYCGCWGWD